MYDIDVSMSSTVILTISALAMNKSMEIAKIFKWMSMFAGVLCVSCEGMVRMQ